MNTKKSYLPAAVTAIILGAAGAPCVPPAMAGGNAMPASAKSYGKSLSEWLKLYFKWAVGGPDQSGPQVDFLPLPSGVETGGSWTVDDPGILEGNLDVSLEPGTAFMLPISAATRERYLDGHLDDPYPDSIFAASEYRVTLDGKVLLDKAPGSLSAYYVFPQQFTPPEVYPNPTPYDSVATEWVQGYGFISPPLQPGVHVLKLHSTIIIEAWDLGIQYENTWTITVKPPHRQ